MLGLIRQHPAAFVASLVVHILLITVFTVSFTAEPEVVTAMPPSISATVVDEAQVEAEAEKLREAREKELKEAQAELEKEKQALAQLRQQREQEEKRREQEKRKKAEAEKKRKAEEARKKAEAEKKRKAEEARKKAEAEKKRKAEEARKRAAAEKKRKAEEARKRAEAELQAQLQAEEAARQNRADQATINRYVGYIQQKVQRNWRKPPNSPVGGSCVVQIQSLPSGDVVSAKVVNSCGSSAMDQSVERAVLKASPLDMPREPRLRDQFRNINFKFRF